MSITINGSGTIGGVSVGGLPDGIVDTDMLASAAVTSAKVGTLGTSNLPAGSVLQVKHASIAGTTDINTTSTSYVDAGMSISITPQNSSSSFLLIHQSEIHHNYNANNFGVDVEILRDNSGIGIGGYWAGSENGLNVPLWQTLMLSFQGYDSPNTTSQITYKVVFKRNLNNGAGYAYYSVPGHSNQGSAMLPRLTVMEIAG